MNSVVSVLNPADPFCQRRVVHTGKPKVPLTDGCKCRSRKARRRDDEPPRSILKLHVSNELLHDWLPDLVVGRIPLALYQYEFGADCRAAPGKDVDSAVSTSRTKFYIIVESREYLCNKLLELPSTQAEYILGMSIQIGYNPRIHEHHVRIR